MTGLDFLFEKKICQPLASYDCTCSKSYRESPASSITQPLHKPSLPWLFQNAIKKHTDENSTKSSQWKETCTKLASKELSSGYILQCNESSVQIKKLLDVSGIYKFSEL
jgi:hypothetical protein